MNENFVNAVKTARENTKDRKFKQTFDLIVNLKLIDLKKPENRLNEIMALPNGRGKDASVVIFSDNIKGTELKVFSSSDITKLGNSKRETKKIAKNTDFFLSEPKLMPIVGKILGKFLAPRGKMPAIMPGDHESMVKRFKKSIRIKVKESPVVQCTIGNEDMTNEEIAENIESVLEFLEKKLPKGRNNIEKPMVKLTMGKPVKIEM